MDGQLKPPKALSFQGNVSENWRRWKQQFTLYMNATGGDEKSEKTQCSILLTVAGEEAVEIFNTFAFTTEEQDKIKPLLDKFEEYCTPRKNITFERHVFNTRTQRSNETIDSYVTDLRKLAKTCEFGLLTDSLIRDRIVCGIESQTVKARLLRENELTLQKTIDICRAAETSQAQLKDLDREAEIHALNSSTSGRNNYSRKTLNPENKTTEKNTYQCGNCGLQHERRKCPAFGKPCLKCHKLNHFARVCRAQIARNEIHEVNEGLADEEMFIGAIDNQGKTMKDWKIPIIINNHKIQLKLDTGAQCNVMPLKSFTNLTKENISKSKTKLLSYSGHQINVVGKGTLLALYKEKYFPVEFQLVDKPNVTPILGLQTCLEMDLIKRVNEVKQTSLSKDHGSQEIVTEYQDVFTGLGCLEGEYKINIDENSKPVVHPPRKVPFALRDKLKAELDRMEKLNVITKVSEPTEWVNSLVVVEKPNGKVRVCLDPRDLNKAIKREYYPMKTIEEVAAELNNAQVFSTLDASSGFWQVKLNEDSTKLVTFNSPFGRYKFLRLPFGINSASEVFQKRINQLFDDIEGCDTIVDDILVWGKDKEEHDRRLRQVLQRAREAGLTLNKEKSKIQTPEVLYIGHILTKDGVKPDDSKVKAILEITPPQDVKELQRFLGMINYLAKFIDNLSDMTMPLRELLQKDIHWHWNDKHEKAFERIKLKVASENVLKYYDVNKPLTLSVDSSSYGLGACLLQEDEPVSFASRSLNKSEKNYAQIEKELLAILFGCNKYHQYIYSKPITVETDHRPLEFLFKKPLISAPKRLQRMMLTLQKYDLHVVYKPGKTLVIADTLSRAPSKETERDNTAFQVHTIDSFPISSNKLEQFQTETEKDLELQTLRNTVMQGWPENKSLVSHNIRDYWIVRDEITWEDGLLFRGERLIVPKSLRQEMLKKIHENHLGIEKCKRRARDLLYWPRMNSEITDMVEKCSICLTYRNSQQKEPMKPHEVPEGPWHKLGVDLLEFKGKDYMVLTDYFSKYFELIKLHDTKSKAIINYLKPEFARHGIPGEVVSDNGPQFSSYEFKNFSKNYGFKHTTSSPRYPQANGLAERTVQTAKGLLKKIEDDGGDINLALLDLRNTPLTNINLSPVQILMGRRTRTLIPTKPSLLRPFHNMEIIKQQLLEKQIRQKSDYDKGAKTLEPLKPGDAIRVRNTVTKAWTPGIVSAKVEQPRSYIVESDGSVLRRNRRDILKTNEPQPLNLPTDIPDITSEKDISVKETQLTTSTETTQDNQGTSNQSNSNKVSSYGRVLRTPIKFKDYEC